MILCAHKACLQLVLENRCPETSAVAVSGAIAENIAVAFAIANCRRSYNCAQSCAAAVAIAMLSANPTRRACLLANIAHRAYTSTYTFTTFAIITCFRKNLT